MPIYRRKNTSKRRRVEGQQWRVVLMHRGERIERAFVGTRQDAKAFEAAELSKLATRPRGEHRGVPTFAEFCEHTYKKHAELHLASSTWKRRKSQLAELGGFFGDMRLDEIGISEVDEYQRLRLSEELKPVSVNNECRVLRAVLNYSARLKLIVSERVVRELKVAEGRVRVWDDKQVKALLAACAEVSPDIVPLVICLLNAGLRKGEAIALTWENVDLERGFLRIWPTVDWKPKNGRPREVPISKALKVILKAQEGKSKEYVFPSASGEAFAFWPKRQFDRARRKAGLQGGPHTARHTFASFFLRAQPDLYLLGKILGHSDMAVTRLYTHLLPDHLERARNAVDISSPFTPYELERQAKRLRSAASRQAGRASGRKRSKRLSQAKGSPSDAPSSPTEGSLADEDAAKGG